MHSNLDVELEPVIGRVTAARAAQSRAETDELLALAEAARAAVAVPSESELRMRSVAAELACAVRVSDRSMMRRLDEALSIVDGFPAVLQAWRDARISRAHAMVIVDAGRVLHGDVRDAFVEVALVRAEVEVPGRLRAALGPVAERFRDEPLSARHATARAERCVRVSALPDGMAELVAILPAVLAFGIQDRLTQQAKAVRNAAVRSRDEALVPDEVVPDERSLDQVRADVLADLLLTGAPTGHEAVGVKTPGGLGAITATVQVMVPVLTLMGEDGEPADLVGRCPIDPATARALAGAASSWDRVLTHPVTGTVLGVDRHDPSAEQKRMLVARDRHCRFPGCRVPAIRCDIDHTIDWACGGATDVSNLAHLCRGHHTVKHHTDWTVRQRTGGTLEWTSPGGRVYTDRPFTTVQFRPDGPPEQRPDHRHRAGCAPAGEAGERRASMRNPDGIACTSAPTITVPPPF